MLGADEKAILHAYVAGRVTDQITADFDAELSAAKAALDFAEFIKGRDVSVALRAAGFKRLYGSIIAGPRIMYERGA